MQTRETIEYDVKTLLQIVVGTRVSIEKPDETRISLKRGGCTVKT